MMDMEREEFLITAVRKARPVLTHRPDPDPPLKQRNRQPDGRKGILTRVMPSTWRALSIHAKETEQSLQDVMERAIADYMHTHGLGRRG